MIPTILIISKLQVAAHEADLSAAGQVDPKLRARFDAVAIGLRQAASIVQQLDRETTIVVDSQVAASSEARERLRQKWSYKALHQEERKRRAG